MNVLTSLLKSLGRRPATVSVNLDAWPGQAQLFDAWAEAFDHAVILLEDEVSARLVAGEVALARCATALGQPESDPAAVLAGVGGLCPGFQAALLSLRGRGEPFDRAVDAPQGRILAAGRVIGGLAMVTVAIGVGVARSSAAPDAGLRALLDAQSEPACILDPDGAIAMANGAWLTAKGAGDLSQDAGATPGGSLAWAEDQAATDLAREAVAAGGPRERVLWTGPGAALRAQRLRASPLPGGAAAVWMADVTDAERAADALSHQKAALTLILDAVADAVALFDTGKRLTHHNEAFAKLWGLEPAWLAGRPTHAALLDRLRQAGRLPEMADFARFKADELARHQRLDPAPEAIWRVAAERILRVLSLPHPAGGLMMVFSDITPEVRLTSQFNHLIQVQQATLDKLTDAVAVFGPDARLKLHNEAFGRLWGVPAEVMNGGPRFDDLVEWCVARLHDMQFWNELKGRITDPDPGVRAAVRGEAAADGRRLAWQSRPLPDGATLVSFTDVTDARRLEGALRDREAALGAAEQLKRDFVSSVSYELRTPLTTILGYSELLATADIALSERSRGWVTAVRAAATDLARSVEDILAFSEIDAGEMILRLSETNLDGLLAEARERWSPRASEQGVALTITSAEPAGAIQADHEGMARVLDHLIEHALRQTAAGGRVALSARRGHGEVCLEVSDSGRGIPFHVQARIFDRFNGEEAAGAGLGLALVKALVELHGGWVAVESEPGAGATFACHLPETPVGTNDSASSDPV